MRIPDAAVDTAWARFGLVVLDRYTEDEVKDELRDAITAALSVLASDPAVIERGARAIWMHRPHADCSSEDFALGLRTGLGIEEEKTR